MTMIIKAEKSDYKFICRSIQNAHIDYITPRHIKEDIEAKRLHAIIKDNKIVAFAAIVFCEEYNNYAIKRLCVPNKKNRGKGYAKTLLRHCINYYKTFLQSDKYPLVCTPWENNTPMQVMLKNDGFQYVNTFNTHWTLYKLTP